MRKRLIKIITLVLKTISGYRCMPIGATYNRPKSVSSANLHLGYPLAGSTFLVTALSAVSHLWLKSQSSLGWRVGYRSKYGVGI